MPARKPPPFDKCAPTPYTPTPADMCGDYLRYPCGLPAGSHRPRRLHTSRSTTAPRSAPTCTSAAAPPTATAPMPVPTPADVPGTVVPDEAGAVVIDCATCPGSAGRVPEGLAPAKVRGDVRARRVLRERGAARGGFGDRVPPPSRRARDARRAERAARRRARRRARRGPAHARDGASRATSRRSLRATARRRGRAAIARGGRATRTWSKAARARRSARSSRRGRPRTSKTRAPRARCAGIAEDETRHAALSWAIARWSLPMLDRADARAHAMRRGAPRSTRSPRGDDRRLERRRGLPSRERARAASPASSAACGPTLAA